MNVGLGRPLALGRTAEVYAWEQGQVLKLFYDWFDLEAIRHEARLAQAVQTTGLPVPRVGRIIHVNGRNGLLYRRIEGPSMGKVPARRPWRVRAYARRTVCAESPCSTWRTCRKATGFVTGISILTTSS